MPDRPPRRLLRGGRVLTPDATPATALAVEGETVVWVGGEDAAEAYAPDADVVEPLDGALVTPGFVDAHVHLVAVGQAAAGLDLSAARSARDALALLEAHVRTRAPRAVLARGWDDATWPDGRPVLAEVDRAVGPRPALLVRVDAHSAIVSSALVARDPAMRLATGWHDDGWVERDAYARARLAADALEPALRAEAMSTALDACAAVGLVGVHEVGAPHLSEPEDLRTARRLAAERPRPEVVPYWGELNGWERAEELGVRGLAGDLCCDGAVGSRTAALAAPYADDPGSGHLYLDAAQVGEHVVGCVRRGLQAGFHAIGDRAVRTVLEGFALAERQVGTAALRGGRHRVEHAELLDEPDVREMARLGLYASVQPRFDAEWGGRGGLYEHRLGPARAARMNPLADLAAHGVPLALGSDAPVTPVGPWAAIRAAVRHRTDGQGLGWVAALDAHTRGGWAAAGDDSAGVLAAGRPASYAVWDLDVREVPDDPLAAVLEAAAEASPGTSRVTVHRGRELHREADPSRMW